MEYLSTIAIVLLNKNAFTINNKRNIRKREKNG